MVIPSLGRANVARDPVDLEAKRSIGCDGSDKEPKPFETSQVCSVRVEVKLPTRLQLSVDRGLVGRAIIVVVEKEPVGGLIFPEDIIHLVVGVDCVRLGHVHNWSIFLVPIRHGTIFEEVACIVSPSGRTSIVHYMNILRVFVGSDHRDVGSGQYESIGCNDVIM